MATMMAPSAAARGRGSTRINVEGRARAHTHHRTVLSRRRSTEKQLALGHLIIYKGYEFRSFCFSHLSHTERIEGRRCMGATLAAGARGSQLGAGGVVHLLMHLLLLPAVLAVP